jgi:hypothetical protein
MIKVNFEFEHFLPSSTNKYNNFLLDESIIKVLYSTGLIIVMKTEILSLNQRKSTR